MKYCEEYAALLDQYVDGELSGAGAGRIREHLEGCPGCRAYVDGALAMRAAFPDVEETEVPEGFAEGVMAAVRRLEPSRGAGAAPGKRRPYWKKILLPLAACFAIVLLIRHGPFRGGAASGGNARADTPADAVAAANDNGAVGYGLTNAGPEEGAAPRMYETGAAPAPRAAPDDPSASCEAAPELQDGMEPAAIMGDQPSAAAPRAIRLRADQAGDLLEELPCTTGEDGTRCYQISAAEFDALLDALEERDIVPEQWAPGPEAEALPVGYDLVYVAEE